jgi:hypothetical protein
MVDKIFRLVNLILGISIVKKIIENKLYSIFFLFFFTVFFSFPSYDIALYTNEMKGNWDAIFLQVKEPFVNHNHLYSIGSHSEKLAFRFVPALFLKVLGIKTIHGAFIFQLFTLLFECYCIVTLSRKYFRSQFAFLFGLCVSLTLCGHVYVSDYRGMFDTLAISLLLYGMILMESIFLPIILLLGYYTDERALIASASIPFFYLIVSKKEINFQNIVKSKTVLLYVGSIILYVIIRFWLKVQFGLEIGTGAIDYLSKQISKIPYSILIGLEGFIIVLYYFLRNNQIKASYKLLYILGILPVFLVALTVIDINRSMSYILPYLFVLFYFFYKNTSPDKVFKTLIIIFFLNMVYDDFYPFVLQLYRMKFITKLF